MMRLAAALALVLLAGCSNKMDPKECDKLRGDAFDLLNKAQFCNTDVDCKPSDWPGCAKPESSVTAEKIKPFAEGFKKGQCDEPKPECREALPVYCKQGLCAHRERGTSEGSGNTPADQIIIK